MLQASIPVTLRYPIGGCGRRKSPAVALKYAGRPPSGALITRRPARFLTTAADRTGPWAFDAVEKPVNFYSIQTKGLRGRTIRLSVAISRIDPTRMSATWQPGSPAPLARGEGGPTSDEPRTVAHNRAATPCFPRLCDVRATDSRADARRFCRSQRQVVGVGRVVGVVPILRVVPILPGGVVGAVQTDSAITVHNRTWQSGPCAESAPSCAEFADSRPYSAAVGVLRP